MKNRAAARTEKALYNSQTELLVSAKPLVAALTELRPLGPQVSQAREQLSVSIGGFFLLPWVFRRPDERILDFSLNPPWPMLYMTVSLRVILFLVEHALPPSWTRPLRRLSLTPP